MTPIVHTSISGAICVVQIDPHWELYIEAKDDLYSNHDLLEVVRRGHVIDRLYEHKDKAPGLIVDLMRSLTKQYGLWSLQGTKQ